MDAAEQLTLLEKEMVETRDTTTPEERMDLYNRIRELQYIVPIFCSVCLDPMVGRHRTWSWCCSASCAGEHYD